MQATVDGETIETWWEARPEANVILVTGRVFDVLDVPAVAGASVLAAVAAVGTFLSYAIRNSKFGLGLLAIGQNEDAAAVLGVPTPRYKALVYSTSAFLPALAGGLYFFKSGIIEPTGAFNLSLSIEAIVMVMLGGQGTVIGPAIGAFLYEELRGLLLISETFSHFQLVVAGGLLLVIVLFVPGGLMGLIHRRFPRTRRWLE